MATHKKGCKGKYKNRPRYKNELSIFEKEILLKIEEFRLARSNWITSKRNTEVTNGSKKAGLNESYVYEGRCICLRKIRFKTNRMREHYQTVRPLRYFTLKKEILDKEVIRSKGSKWRDDRWEDIFDNDLLEGIIEEEYKLKKERERLCKEKEKDIQELVTEKVKQEITGKVGKKKSPKQKAMENMKASKHAGRFVESCKCKDGKEVTVVIKGFCLCDKGNLKKFKLNKITDDYNKLEESKIKTTDSRQFRKRQACQKSVKVKEEEKEEKKFSLAESKSTKNVTFGQCREKAEKIEEQKRKKECEEEQKERKVCEEKQKRKKECEEGQRERRVCEEKQKRKKDCGEEQQKKKECEEKQKKKIECQEKQTKNDCEEKQWGEKEREGHKREKEWKEEQKRKKEWKEEQKWEEEQQRMKEQEWEKEQQRKKEQKKEHRKEKEREEEQKRKKGQKKERRKEKEIGEERGKEKEGEEKQRKEKERKEEQRKEKEREEEHQRKKEQKKEHRKEKEREEEQKGNREQLKDLKKEVLDSASIITLYKNRPANRSEMALTQEQLEKIKNNQ